MAVSIKQVVPILNRIVVKKVAPMTQTKKGILLPEQKERIFRGTVVAVGPGTIKEGKRVKPTVKVGDVVLIPDYSGTQVQIESEDEYVIIREPDILAVEKK